MDKFITSDLGLAIYCRMRGMRLKVAKRTGKKFEFEFEEPDTTGKAMRVDWINSESYQFDQAAKAVKSLLYSDREEKGV